MRSGESWESGRSRLRLAAVVGEIEGLWTAWLRARGPGRRARLLAELGQAGARLAAEAALAAQAAQAAEAARTAEATGAVQAQRSLARSFPSMAPDLAALSALPGFAVPQSRTRRRRRLVAARRGADWIVDRFTE